MKKNLKKALVLSTTLSASVAVGATTIHSVNNNTQNINTNKISSTTNSLNNNVTYNSEQGDGITFNNKNYLTVEDAINDFLTTNGTVTQKLYLGDVNSAISSNDYNTVDLNKLKEVKDNNVMKAYKTLTDDYTSDLTEAKKSYLQNPVIKWSDRQGNLYDSEYEAKYAMQNNGDYFTDPVAYYEVKDYSRLDNFKQPEVVKINPLNNNDLNALKKIAARNMLIDNSGFGIERYSVNLFTDKDTSDSLYQQTSNFNGYSDSKINEMAQEIANKAMESVRDNMWLNVKPVAVANNPELWLFDYSDRGPSYGSMLYPYEKIKVSIQFDTLGYNPNSSVDVASIRNDAKYFASSQSDWNQKFDMKNSEYGDGSFQPFTDLVSKSNQSVLGGQSLHFRIKNGATIASKHRYKFNPNIVRPSLATIQTGDIGFLGKGNRSSGYITFNINQNNVSTMLNNPTQENVYKQKMSAVATSVTNYLTDIFNKLGFQDYSQAKQDAIRLGQEASQMLTQDVLKGNSVTSKKIMSASDINDALDAINPYIVSSLDTYLRKQNKETLTETIARYLSWKYQATESTRDLNTFYAVTYNNQPLYKIDSSIITDLIGNSDFETQPLDTLKRYLSQNLSSNYDAYINTLSNGFTNISNSYSFKNGEMVMKFKAIDQYEASSGTDGVFSLDQNTSNPNGFDSNVKLFDQNVFANNSVDTANLEKQLNRRESDDQATLNNQYGTFEAVYQYNKTLQEKLNNANASDTLKQQVSKNALKNPNDVVVLYNSNKTPATIKYGEYLNYGYKFNESLTDSKVKVLNSTETRNYEIEAENLNIPTKNYTYHDYNGNVLISENVDQVNGSYDSGAQQVYLNALNKLVVPASTQYVYYVDQNGNKELVKNQTTKLNILKIVDNGNTYYYGFTKYSDLYNYAANYVKLSTGMSDNNQSLFTRSNTPAILSGFYTSLAIVILAEVVVMSYVFVKNNKNINISKNKSFNFR